MPRKLDRDGLPIFNGSEDLSLAIAEAIRRRLSMTPAVTDDRYETIESTELTAKRDGHGAHFITTIEGPDGREYRRMVIVTEP